ncbi:uncharacterized protein ACA1_380900 [Acanthamoeba castellanii str. Neff]|uniref:Uncharacterized protein n=1 Tax=Acanthamoeba castellanii (strain ATCC 30010 / Neff) TaxID=1257118 RepID=L8GP36_ACACF|nr:uncharacterized protein ACA1_380900 [Acanthamoeba castellanii str. Neff]ELR14413.1 hypothetical protein ACA1_380900 [Acanthamoeba castellanii str. Neff]
MHTNDFFLVAASSLLLLVMGAQGQDPTTYIKPYPALTYTQAWQISTCVYTVKYTIKGQPGISNFGFQLGNDRDITVSGCADDWEPKGGAGNCPQHYSAWDGPGGGGLVKLNTLDSCRDATFWITASEATLLATGSMVFKGGQICSKCTDVPYVLADHPDPASCSAAQSPATPTPTPTPSPLPSTSISSTPSGSSSPASAASSPSASPSAYSSASPSVSPSSSPSPSAPASPSSPSPSSSPSASPSTSPSASAPLTPLASASPAAGGDSSNAGAIAGGVAGGLAGLAGLAGLGGAAAGAGYLLYRYLNKPPAPDLPVSALDSGQATVVGENALFQETNVMQPNALYVV